MAYRTTYEADVSILDLYNYGLRKFGKPQTETYVEGLLDTFELLASSPYMVRLRSEVEPPVRIFPYRSHLIIYVVENEDVVILKILHGSSDWQRRLGE